jgi:hypothetical protein
MHQRVLFPLLTAFTLGLAGCGDGGESPEANPDSDASSPSTTTSSSESTGLSMDSVKAKAQAAMDSANEASHQAMEAVAEVAGIASEQAELLGAEAQAQAQQTLDKVRAYLEDNQLGSAEDLMVKLSELKESLPESMREQIDALELKLDALQSDGSDEAPSDEASSQQ